MTGKLLIVISTFLCFGVFSQKVQFTDSSDLQNIDLKKYSIVNISNAKSISVEKKTDFFIDFGVADIPQGNIDSMLVKIGEKSYTNPYFSPFIIKNVKAAEIHVFAFNNGDTLNFKASESNMLQLSVREDIKPILVHDTMVFGLLAIVLALIFYTASLKTKFWKRFYMVVPSLLLCYLIPAILDLLGVISAQHSNLYNMAKDYLLPGALILMTLGIDFKGIINLGPKALIMFLTATVGIIIGGPIAIIVYSWIDPSVVGGEGYDAAWRGFATLAGSWIGGGANQAAMLETYKYNPDLYGKMVTVDIVVANLWMAFLLWAAARTEKFDRWLKADTSSIEALKQRMTDYHSTIAKQPVLSDYMVILGITFGIVGISHLLGNELAIICDTAFGHESPFASSFFWLVVLATTGGLLLSATKLRRYEGAGASKIGSVFIYILVATIGMKMDLKKAVEEPQLILVGIIWMLVHVGILLIVAKLIRAPFFFVAVGSKANVGGAASAPIVAAAFHPSLASVGAILAVLGYALGTYGAIVSAEIMRWVAP